MFMFNGNLVAINKYSTLTCQVELQNSDYLVNQYALNKALSNYYDRNLGVFLFVNDQHHLVGNIFSINAKSATIDLLDNAYGAFVQRMLYHAVNYKLVAVGLGQVSNDQKSLLGFKVNKLVITDYTKWF